MLFRTSPVSPTLLALALLAGSAFGSVVSAATADERDQHFMAIATLLGRDLRQPGERQQKAFADAGYPDDGWYRKGLTWYATLKAKEAAKDPKQVTELDKAASALFNELDAANDAGKLPEPVAQLVASAGSRTAQLLRDLSGFMNADEPAGPRAPERVAIASAQVSALIEAATKEWLKAKAKIKANEPNEKGMFDGESKEEQAKVRVATMLRFEAVKVIYNAHSALREVITRGKDFGLDPAPAAAFMKGFMKENAAALGDWDYSFGDYFAYLKAYAATVMLECIRQQIPNQRLDDLEASLQAVTAIDLKPFKNPADREDMQHLQIRCWTALLRTRLELALAETDKAKAKDMAAKGLEMFDQFRDIYKGQRDMTPGVANNTSRAWYLGQLWITAARLQMVKGDNPAALLGEVVANRATFASQLAGKWLRGGGGTDTGGEWGKPTIAIDPGQALVIAQAIRREAQASMDDKAKRRQLLSAAVQLRAGVAGLSGAWSEQFVENGPEIYDAYARVLAQLDLRYHAALAAAEGLRQIGGRITKDSNPWRKGAAFTEQGAKVRLLARDAINLAGQLSSRSKGSGAADLQSDVIELVKRISPEDAGQGADDALIANDLADRQWERVISRSKDYLKKYPDGQAKSYAWLVSAYSGWYDEAKKANDEGKAKTVAAQLTEAAAAMEKEAKEALARNPPPDQAKSWMRVLSTVQSAKLSVLLADKQYSEVLTKFGPDFWKNPPADENLRGRVLRGMCSAVGGAETARTTDEKAKSDPQSLLAAWKTYEATYNLFHRFLPSIKDPAEHDKTTRFGKNMANALNSIAYLAEQLAKRPGAPPELLEAGRAAKRALADLLEPVTGPTDKPATIQFVADTLWSLDEHAKAVRLYEMLRKVVEGDQTLTDFLADPKAVLDAAGEAIGKRPEVAGDWSKVRDLVEDKPGLKDLIKQGVAESEYGEKKANFTDALIALRDFRTKAEALKTKLGAEGWSQADAALKALEKQLQNANLLVSIKARLAQGYREAGQADEARKLYEELYAYEPDNPLYAAAFVDIVLDGVRNDPTKASKADEEKARDIARKIRDDARKNLDLSWQASIQVMELSLALGDNKQVNDLLKFNGVNHSGPSYDLVQPAVLPDERQSGDDKRVRRARNALGIELAKRYLELFKGNAISEKPTFRIDEVAGPDGKAWTLFVPTDAPKFEAQTVTNADDAEVVVFVETGKSAQKAAAPEPAPAVPAPAGVAPAAPAPAGAAPKPATATPAK